MGFFTRRKVKNTFLAEFHNHILPGVDDGLKDTESSIQSIRAFQEFGYKKLIMTPHIHPDRFPNNEEDLIDRYNQLKSQLPEDISIDLQLGAEYYLHDQLMEKIRQKKRLLTIHDSKLLIETSFHFKTLNFEHELFEIHTAGYEIIIAHPERYLFVAENIEIARKWKDMGVFLQINSGSLLGRYGKEVAKVTRKMIKEGLIDFIGSDFHRPEHFDWHKRTIMDPFFVKFAASKVRNNQLL